MLKIGLTGNRFSGKSVICKMFSQIGIPIFDADTVLKFILLHDLETINSIKDKYGQRFLDGYFIDKSSIRKKEDFDLLVDCAEPALMNAYQKFNDKNHIYTIFKSSILFEREWDKNMNYNINIFCPKIYRMERLKEITKEKVADIAFLLRNEVDDLKKNSMAHFVIHNYDSSTSQLDQVNKIDSFIIDEYLKKKKIESLTPDGMGVIVDKHFSL